MDQWEEGEYIFRLGNKDNE